jgi:hypothetical protein
MNDARMPIGRWERAKQDKRERSMAAARELFAEHGVGEVTTQQVADRADAAIDTAVPVCLHEGGATDHGAEPEVRRRHRHRPSRCSRHSKARPAGRRHRAHPPSGGRVCVSRSRTDAPICTSSSSGILRALPTRGTRPLSPTRGRHRAPADTRRAHRRPRCPTCRQCSQSSHMCRLTAVRRSSRRTRSQDRDGATTCGTCRAPTG